MSLDTKLHKDFSVIIPTFNRSSFLRKALFSVLRQKGVSFEIIVSDNASTDDTEKVVKEFKDKRIKYFKNKENLGFSGNIKNCFSRSSGKYIFTLGDDDLILNQNTLLEALKVMRKLKVGVANIGTIYWSKSPKFPCKAFILSDKLIVLKPRRDKKLSLKSLDFNVSFFSGLIFDNSLIDISKITTSFTYAYFPFVYDVILKKGIAYIPDHFIVGYISYRFVPHYYDIEKLGSFYMEDYLNLMRGFLSREDYQNHKKKFLQESTILLPSIKLFTNNKNYLQVLQKLIALDKSLLWYPKFIAMALIGFLPKFILQILRNLMIYREEKKIAEMVNKYNYFQSLEKLGV